MPEPTKPPSNVANQAVGIREVPVRVQGVHRVASVAGKSAGLVPFSEHTCTVIVFENGAVIPLRANPERGQIVVVTNLRSDQEMVCRVLYARKSPAARNYAEIQFTHPMRDFWGVYDPHGVLKSPRKVQNVGATPEKPAKPRPMAPPPTSAPANVLTLPLPSTPATDCSQASAGLPPPETSHISQSMLTQPTTTAASQLSLATLRREEGPAPAQANAYPSTRKHFPIRARILAGAAAAALCLAAAVRNFSSPTNTSHIAVARTNHMPVVPSVSVEADDVQPVLSQMPIEVKTQGLLSRSMQLADGDMNHPAGTSMERSDQSTDTPESRLRLDTPIPAPAREGATTGTSDTLGTIFLISNPAGAEVYVDDSFMGKAPATLSLRPGPHSIRAFANDYQNWSQWITVMGGSQTQMTATLEKKLN